MHQKWCFYRKHLLILHLVRFIKQINFNLRAGY